MGHRSFLLASERGERFLSCLLFKKGVGLRRKRFAADDRTGKHAPAVPLSDFPEGEGRGNRHPSLLGAMAKGSPYHPTPSLNGEKKEERFILLPGGERKKALSPRGGKG